MKLLSQRSGPRHTGKPQRGSESEEVPEEFSDPETQAPAESTTEEDSWEAGASEESPELPWRSFDG